jgi:hypothetical protein
MTCLGYLIHTALPKSGGYETKVAKVRYQWLERDPMGSLSTVVGLARQTGELPRYKDKSSNSGILDFGA